MDKSTILELADFIIESIRLINKRFQNINSSDDFLKNDEAIEKLDSIAMRLQAIGEALKNLDKREKELLLQVADTDYWSKIIRTRDILSHHYIDIDAETVYMICSEKLNDLNLKINQLKELVISNNS